MNVQTEHLENHTARLTVNVDPARVDKALNMAARRISKKARIPGFRPGKAPTSVVINLFGREYVLDEALDRLGQEVYKEALDAAELKPYAPGSLEDVNEDDGFVLAFIVPKRPEVDLGDYRSVRGDYEVEEVTDDMVNQAMENMRENQAVVEKVDRPAKMGDQLHLAFVEVVAVPVDEMPSDDDDTDTDEESAVEKSGDEAESSDAVDADGDVDDEDEDDDIDDDEYDEDDDDDDDDDEVLIHQHNYDYVLRDDDRDLFPGFSAQLVGLSAEDEKTFVLTVPDDYDMEDIAGRTLDCEVHVETVNARTVPEWSDTLAENVSDGEFETQLELRINVRKQLEENAKRVADQNVASSALEQIVEMADIRYPDELVQNYIDDILGELDANMRRQNLTLDDFLKITGRKLEEVRNEYRDPAVHRAERALVMGELVQQEKLEISHDDLIAEVDRMIETMAGSDQADLFKQFLMAPESQLNIANRMVTDRALERLAAIAKGEAPELEPEDEAAAGVDAAVADDAAADAVADAEDETANAADAAADAAAGAAVDTDANAEDEITEQD
ncbi:MAG: hypothetical protein JW966_13750 [Anaerolineae bacterium]|nr:hypothetical protein [Anaerolineae bacterium]